MSTKILATKVLSTKLLLPLALSILVCSIACAAEADKRYSDPIDLNVPHISSDPTVQYDYPIVYVRVPRQGTTLSLNGRRLRTRSNWIPVAI